MKDINLRECYICETRDRTIYLTALEIGADAISTYGDDYRLLTVQNIFVKNIDYSKYERYINNEYNLCAEFTINGNDYVVIF